ncbi:MAG: hypothetical protein GY792_29840 [Gammaproteobacteria bacterium]|nr:hypothetical protein [Gammaproteobacteria bacterium]MCP5090365.1 hypothetical protein [Gammaproteobacteria bacterium]
MRISYTLPIVLCALLSVSCAQQLVRKISSEDSSLQHWLDNELASYLTEALGRHPRFKGEPVILVRLDGPDIQPDIDGLTRSMRDQLMDHLLMEPGVILPWQSQRQPAQHHRRLDRVQCGRIRDASYYIGIEITRNASSQYRVSVRALDVQAGEWASGFGKHWTGHLTVSEERALQERHRDESLRGLRVLPFSDGHPDLAATYLANNLSCLLRQQDKDNLVIYIEPLQSDQPRLRTLLSLIGNNLSRYREVRVTDRKKEAGYLLRGETYQIQSGLYQVWVVLHPIQSGEHLSGMDTATWVRIQPGHGTTETPRIVEHIYEPKPAITALELVGRNNSTNHCARQRTGRNSHGGCPMLEVTVERSDDVFVFVHGARDGISRLSSGRCVQGNTIALDVPGILRYEFPAERFKKPDWPTIYAIAVNDRQLAQQFQSHLQRLPDACGYAAGLHRDNRMNPWLNTLDRLIADNSDSATWSARRIP